MKIFKNLPPVALLTSLSAYGIAFVIGGLFFIMQTQLIFDVEIWKDIPDYEGFYQASTLGVIKSIDRTVYHTRGFYMKIKSQILKSAPNQQGYLNCVLCKDGKTKTYRVNRLIALTFIPNPENKPEVNHENGIKSDNRVTNLKWMTPSENVQHSFDTGLQSNIGEKHPSAKLTENQVREIISLFYIKQNKELASTYNTSVSTIEKIKLNKTWTHITRKQYLKNGTE